METIDIWIIEWKLWHGGESELEVFRDEAKAHHALVRACERDYVQEKPVTGFDSTIEVWHSDTEQATLVLHYFIV